MNPTKEQKNISSHIAAIIGSLYYRDLNTNFIDDVIIDEISNIPSENLNKEKIEKACIIILNEIRNVNKRSILDNEE